MFNRFWKSISLIGVQAHYQDKLVKRVTLTNQFICVAMILFILSGIINFVLGDYFSAAIIEFFGIICASGIYFNYKGYHRFATSYLFVAISTSIFYFDSYSGLAAGVYLYHFPLILAVAFVFDFNDKYLLLVHLLMPITYLIINVSTNYSLFANEQLTAQDRYIMFMFNLTFSASAIGFFMFLTIANNLKENEIFEQRMNERKATEQAIKQALNEKDILLAEIHHRVKNNLAIIASLFNLQIGTVENEEAKSILTDSKNRVKSMALIHDRLYKSNSLSEIDFSDYIHELIAEMQYSYPTVSGNVKVETNVSDLKLNVNKAIPCGLVLNELLTNCYKHAFKGRTNGVISITFKREEDKFLKLSVSDNGVGLKEEFRDTGSLGMIVIESLSDQLDGVHTFTSNGGTHFELRFEQI